MARIPGLAERGLPCIDDRNEEIEALPTDPMDALPIGLSISGTGESMSATGESISSSMSMPLPLGGELVRGGDDDAIIELV